MRKNILAFFLCGIFSSAYAQWTVFDPSNFARNTVTSIQAVQSTSTLINQYQTQLNQYQNQILQHKNIDPSSVAGMLARNSAEHQNAITAAASMNNLYGSLGSVQRSFNNRLDTAKAMGIYP